MSLARQPGSAWVQVQISIDAEKAFEDVEWALLIGAKPRGPGMERRDLLDLNGAGGPSATIASPSTGHRFGAVSRPDNPQRSRRGRCRCFNRRPFCRAGAARCNGPAHGRLLPFAAGQIFEQQGKALDKVAKKNVKVMVSLHGSDSADHCVLPVAGGECSGRRRSVL